MEKKVRKEFEIKISNKLFYILVTISAIVVLGIGVYALTPGVKPVMGHLLSEVAPPSGCVSGQYLKWSGTSWSCATPISPTPECTWTGWESVCSNACISYTQINCAPGSPAIRVSQRYCSSGSVTQTRFVYCCPSENGACPAPV